jgi:hypothetical protein
MSDPKPASWGWGHGPSGLKRPLAPVSPEEEKAAVQAWLEKNRPTQLPPGFAIGGEPRMVVGRGRGRFFGGGDNG